MGLLFKGGLYLRIEYKLNLFFQDVLDEGVYSLLSLFKGASIRVYTVITFIEKKDGYVQYFNLIIDSFMKSLELIKKMSKPK